MSVIKRFNGEINNHLKGCSVKWYSIGEDETMYLVFDVEFDDVDPEFEDW